MQSVEDLCIHKKGDLLYQRVADTCAKHTSEVITGLQPLAQNVNSFLDAVRRAWDVHQQQMVAIRAIFIYLDRAYVAQTSTVAARSLSDMGLTQFRSEFLGNGTVKSRTIRGLLDSIKQERLGEAVDRMRLRALVRMFISLRIYADELEAPLLRESRIFYQLEGEQAVKTLETADYLKRAEERISEEVCTCDSSGRCLF